MKNIGDIIKQGEYKTKLPTKLFKANISAVGYSDAFLKSVSEKMQFTDESFVVDESNKDIINQLYYYLNGSDKFNGSHIKGILLIGAFGCGKTLIMEAFIDVFNKVADKIITTIGAKDITDVSTENGYGFLWKRPLFIDDIGKEQMTEKNYGTTLKPLEDLINERYKKGGLTFGTSNLKLEDMKYNGHTKDRINQMFNIIVLPGKSRRK